MRIAVLRGGKSLHYDESLKTGEMVLSVLRDEPRYRPLDIFVSKEGEWHYMGQRQEPHNLLKHVDLVWNAMHGEFGEDGKLGQLLSQMNVPHTGSTSLHLAFSLNKDLAKKVFSQHNLLTPKHEVLLGTISNEDLIRIFQTYLHPVVVKPVSTRSSLGERVAHSFNELKDSVVEAFKHAERVIVEELIRGDSAKCGVVENFRGKSLYTLIPTPSTFKSDVHKEIERMASEAHRALGLRHYSTSEFVVTPKGKVYILETTALPVITPESHMHQSLEGVGITPREFVNHVINMAI